MISKPDKIIPELVVPEDGKEIDCAIEATGKKKYEPESYKKKYLKYKKKYLNLKRLLNN